MTKRLLTSLVIIISMAFLCPVEAFSQIPDDLAVQALIGEAGGQSYEELLAHAHALKNRDSLKGVYGLNSPQVKMASGETWQMASKAWNEAKDGPDMTLGATHWLSSYDLACSKPKLIAWKDSMAMTGKWGETYFYRESRRN